MLTAAIRLSADTTPVPVDRGNDTQFGWYEGQMGSCAATIGREEQQSITIEAVVEFPDNLVR